MITSSPILTWVPMGMCITSMPSVQKFSAKSPYSGVESHSLGALNGFPGKKLEYLAMPISRGVRIVFHPEMCDDFNALGDRFFACSFALRDACRTNDTFFA